MTEKELKIGYFNGIIEQYCEARRRGDTDTLGVWAACHTDLDSDEELFGEFLIYAQKTNYDAN
jgi:hypothetical protein